MHKLINIGNRRAGEGSSSHAPVLSPEQFSAIIVGSKEDQKYVKKILKADGCILVEPIDNLEALFLQNGPTTNVDLVLVSLAKLGDESFELLRELRKSRTVMAGAAVVVVTPVADLEAVGKCLVAGADHCVQRAKLKESMAMVWASVWGQKRLRDAHLVSEGSVRSPLMEKKVSELEEQLEKLQLQVNEAVRTPVQVIYRTVDLISRQEGLTEEVRNALSDIIRSLSSSNMYEPAFVTELKKLDTLDDATRDWLNVELSVRKRKTTSRTPIGATPRSYSFSNSIKINDRIESYDSSADNNGENGTEGCSVERLKTPRGASQKGGSRRGSATGGKTKEGEADGTSGNGDSVAELDATSEDSEEVEAFMVDTEALDFSRLQSWDCDLFLTEKEDTLLNYFMVFMQDFDLLTTFKIEQDVLRSFLLCARSKYNPNPYHNFRHAWDVTQACYHFLTIGKAAELLTPLEILAVLLGAISHDLEHPGLNNLFQVNIESELALTYNDISVLENHHARVLFTILSKPECNILSNLAKEQRKELRRLVIDVVLATDIARFHVEICTKFGAIVPAFDKENAEHRLLLLQMLIKAADISNPGRPINTAKYWAEVLLTEFFAQGDEEKRRGLPVSPMMDRETVKMPQSQINFIKFVVLPMYKSIAELLPSVKSIVETLETNSATWQQWLAEEAAAAAASADVTKSSS